MIIALLLLYLIGGVSVITLCEGKVKTSLYQQIAAGMIIGMGLGSLVPLLLTLVGVGLSRNSILILTLVVTLIPLVWVVFKGKIADMVPDINQFVVHIYEFPFLLLVGYFLSVSVWKCYYYPNIPFDTLVGADLVAKASFMEGTLANSVYKDFLPTTFGLSNQPYYAPFTMLMEVIFLFGGSLFGKLWLSILVVSFWIFFYFELRHYVHPLLAGVLALFAFYSPEMYAYTFLVQTDYANAIFLFVSVAFLYRFVHNEGNGYLVLSALLFGLACWTRTETIFFGPLIALVLVLNAPMSFAVKYSLLFAAIGIFLIVLWNYIFLGNMVPKPIVLGEFRFLREDYLGELVKTVKSMNTFVFNKNYWGYSATVPLILLVANLLLFRKKTSLEKWIWPLGVYLIFLLIILHVYGANVQFTFRRGFFKIILLLYLMVASSGLFEFISEKLSAKVARPSNS